MKATSAFRPAYLLSKYPSMAAKDFCQLYPIALFFINHPDTRFYFCSGRDSCIPQHVSLFYPDHGSSSLSFDSKLSLILVKNYTFSSQFVEDVPFLVNLSPRLILRLENQLLSPITSLDSNYRAVSEVAK